MSLYDDVTPESIKADFFDGYTGRLDTREGSFLDLLISPLAWELYKAYRALNSVTTIIFPDETSDLYLDADGATLGIYRRAGTTAEATVTFAGSDGLTVPAGTAFLTADGREYRLAEDVTLTEGAGSGTLRALEAGAAYNAPAGAINRVYRALPGLTSFSAGEALGGSDQESNLSLYNRISYYRRHPSSSGNVADYYKWATSVDGVGDACVIPVQNGPGTVGVIISAPEGGAVAPGIVEAVKAYIETQRPIGATVTVTSATERKLAIAAKVTHEDGTDLQTIKEAFTAALGDYLTGVGISGGVLSYNRVAYLLLSIPGVVDFSELTVDGDTDSVTLDPGVSAMVDTVDISEVPG